MKTSSSQSRGIGSNFNNLAKRWRWREMSQTRLCLQSTNERTRERDTMRTLITAFVSKKGLVGCLYSDDELMEEKETGCNKWRCLSSDMLISRKQAIEMDYRLACEARNFNSQPQQVAIGALFGLELNESANEPIL